MGIISEILEGNTSRKDMIQESFALVAPISEKAAEIFYTKLFDLDPALKALFNNDMKEQGKKLMAMIATAVKGLDRPESIIGAVQDLGKRHVGYKVEEAHYDTVGTALLYTLEAGLGEKWNEDLKTAWAELYTDLAVTMKKAASEV